MLSLNDTSSFLLAIALHGTLRGSMNSFVSLVLDEEIVRRGNGWHTALLEQEITLGPAV